MILNQGGLVFPGGYSLSGQIRVEIRACRGLRSVTVDAFLSGDSAVVLLYRIGSLVLFLTVD